MGYSDVNAVFITADTQALDADGISAAAAVGDDANLTIGGALASGGSCTFDSGRVVTIYPQVMIQVFPLRLQERT